MNLKHVKSTLSRHEPKCVETPPSEQAAVAVVLREQASDVGTEVLLIERALRDGDPWSGHMAFPGGRRDPSDPSSYAVAQRETHEEVGLELVEAEYLGHIDDLMGNPRVSPNLVISAHAFVIDRDTPFRLDPLEVQTALWVPLADLHEPSTWVEHSVPELPDVRFPGLLVGEPGRHVVWGLTYRFLDRMLALLGRPFPDRWGDLGRFVDPD